MDLCSTLFSHLKQSKTKEQNLHYQGTGVINSCEYGKVAFEENIKQCEAFSLLLKYMYIHIYNVVNM